MQTVHFNAVRKQCQCKSRNGASCSCALNSKWVSIRQNSWKFTIFAFFFITFSSHWKTNVWGTTLNNSNAEQSMWNRTKTVGENFNNEKSHGRRDPNESKKIHVEKKTECEINSYAVTYLKLLLHKQCVYFFPTLEYAKRIILLLCKSHQTFKLVPIHYRASYFFYIHIQSIKHTFFAYKEDTRR